MSDVDSRSTGAELAKAILILRALDTDTTTAHRLAEVMAGDHALCRRLLRLAHSPMYGVAVEDLTVGRAIVLVGFKTIRNLAVLSAGRGLTADDVDTTRWLSALTTGIATEQLALRAGVDGADGLVAGMLSRLVEMGDGDDVADELADSMPHHIVEAMRVDEHAEPDLSLPILGRLVRAGMAVAAVMIAFDPGIPPSRDLEHALEATSFHWLSDQRLATDIRRGVELYSGLSD